MCTGTALLYKIPRVIVGENQTFNSFAEGVFKDRGVEVEVMQNKVSGSITDFAHDT